jgi:hypothetical protein
MPLVIAGTDYIQMPAGTTAQRPASPVIGMERYNTTLGYVEVYDGAAWVPMGSEGGVISGTAQTASGTAVSFTGIPSWVKRITVLFNGVSLNGSANLLVQIGVGTTPTTSGYSSNTTYALIGSSGTAGVSSTAGYVLYLGQAAYVLSGQMVISNVSGNNWVAFGIGSNSATTAFTAQMSGTGSLASTLGMVRVTTTNGTDTFDAGTINILYE